jgi:hypothetical protein
MKIESPALQRSTRVSFAALAVIAAEVVALLWSWRHRDAEGTFIALGLLGCASIGANTIVSFPWVDWRVRSRGCADFLLRWAALTAIGVAVEAVVLAVWMSTVTDADDLRARTAELSFGPPFVIAALVPSFTHVVWPSDGSRSLARDLSGSAVAVLLILRWSTS